MGVSVMVEIVVDAEELKQDTGVTNGYCVEKG